MCCGARNNAYFESFSFEFALSDVCRARQLVRVHLILPVAARPIPAIARTFLVRGVRMWPKFQKRIAPRIRERENSRNVAEAHDSAQPFPSLGSIHLMQLGFPMRFRRGSVAISGVARHGKVL